MNLENKSLVSGLLNTLHKINSVKDDIDYIKSVRYSTIDKNLLGDILYQSHHSIQNLLKTLKIFWIKK